MLEFDVYFSSTSCCISVCKLETELTLLKVPQTNCHTQLLYIM